MNVYTLWTSNNGEYYLFEGEVRNPNYWFADKEWWKYPVKVKGLTAEELEEIITKYDLKSKWYPGEYCVFTTDDELMD